MKNTITVVSITENENNFSIKYWILLKVNSGRNRKMCDQYSLLVDFLTFFNKLKNHNNDPKIVVFCQKFKNKNC